MTPFIRLTRIPYEEPYHLQLQVEASNERERGELEIYCNADDLGAFAEQLQGFPRSRDAVALWELGSERAEDRFAFYYRLRAYQLSPSGACGLEVRFCNNLSPPLRAVVEFSIEVLPAGLDRFAHLLREFGRLQHTTLDWNPREGELR